MAILKIEPVKLTSQGGSEVTITGLDPTDHDCLIGQYWTGKDGPHYGAWNLTGKRRDGTDASNLKVADIAELKRLALQLGAKQ